MQLRTKTSAQNHAVFVLMFCVTVIFFSAAVFEFPRVFHLPFVLAQTGVTGTPVQTGAASTSVSTVYLVQPDTSVLEKVPTIQGQSAFEVHIATPANTQQPKFVSIELLEGSLTQGFLYCGLPIPGLEGAWTLTCDTTPYQDGLYSVRIHAYTSSDVSPTNELKLGRLSGTDYIDPVFGPIHIVNTYAFLSPLAGEVVKGAVPIRISLPGDANGVKFTETSLDGSVRNIQDAQRQTVSTVATEWQALWDTTGGIPDGNYAISAAVDTMGGIQRDGVISQSVKLQNHTALTCTSNWFCGDWSACTAGIQYQLCTDKGGCAPDRKEQRECLVQTSPAAPTNTNVQTNASILNSSTNASALNSNSSGSTANARSNPVPVSSQAFTPPVILITSPTAGAVLQGTVTLSVQVKGDIAKAVEFYRNDPNGQRNLYTGKAQNSNGVWVAKWSTDETINGAYELFARVQASNDQLFISDGVKVSIQNGIASPPPRTTPSTSQSTEGKDSDGDGIPDDVELRYGTNPFDPDSDHDGINDREQALLGVQGSNTNTAPTSALQQAVSSLSLEDPRTMGIENTKKLSLKAVSNVQTGEEGKKIVFQGLGPPDSLVTLFIYSSPLVVTTKTDASGNFTYILDKNLIDGKHEAYVTVTDSTGKITEKSSQFSFFVRQAQAVSEAEFLRGDVNVNQPNDALTNYIIISLMAVLGGFFVFVLIRMVKLRKPS